MLDTWHAAGCTSRAKNANKKPAEAGRVWPSPSVGLVAGPWADLLCDWSW